VPGGALPGVIGYLQALAFLAGDGTCAA